jgi:biotin carboxyl carrier protein
MTAVVENSASPCYGISNHIQMITSPYYGIVEKVLIENTSHIYEWEPLFFIKTLTGEYKTIAVAVSGYITSVEVKQGDLVNLNTPLALLQDDLLVTGSD